MSPSETDNEKWMRLITVIIYPGNRKDWMNALEKERKNQRLIR